MSELKSNAPDVMRWKFPIIKDLKAVSFIDDALPTQSTIDAEYIEYIRADKYNALQNLLDEMTAYADKLADGYPEGMLPKDVEVLKSANVGLQAELDDIHASIDKAVEEMARCVNNLIDNREFARSVGLGENDARAYCEGLEKALNILRKHGLIGGNK